MSKPKILPVLKTFVTNECTAMELLIARLGRRSGLSLMLGSVRRNLDNASQHLETERDVLSLETERDVLSLVADEEQNAFKMLAGNDLTAALHFNLSAFLAKRTQLLHGADEAVLAVLTTIADNQDRSCEALRRFPKASDGNEQQLETERDVLSFAADLVKNDETLLNSIEEWSSFLRAA